MGRQWNFLFALLLFFSWGLSAQNYWRFNPNAQQKGKIVRSKIPKGTKRIFLDVEAIRAASTSNAKGIGGKTVLYFPNEKDEFEAFELTETTVIAPHIARWAPDIKTYRGISKEREGVSIRTTISSRGVNFVMRLGHEMMFMEYQKDSNEHIYYTRKDIETVDDLFRCGVVSNEVITDGLNLKKLKNIPQLQARVTSDQVLRTFRIAIAATATYTAHWGTQNDAYNAVVNTISRVNEVFETDLGVTFTLVSTQSLIFTDPTVNPLRIGDTSGGNSEGTNVLLGVMNTISSTLDVNDYDIGHGFHKLSTAEINAGFSTSFGLRPAVCNNNNWNSYGIGPVKAGGISRTRLNGGTDAFDIDYVAHEIGHQFGAEHTWSYDNSSTGFSNNRSAEPGSGTTIMGYAGTTSHNVQGRSDPYFHFVTIDQVHDLLTSGFTCQSTSVITNDVPTIDAGSDVSIPHSTAYYLDASSTDANTPLYFCWEPIDVGAGVLRTNFGPELATGPMARSLPPTPTTVRVIPNMNRVVAGELTKTNPANVNTYPTTNDDWETVSTKARTLKWGVTVRDRSNTSVLANGQINQDSLTISVVGTAGPFAVTSQASNGIIYNGGDSVTVSWDVANTNIAPINTANVNIVLSTDGGYTYPTTLVSNTSNDGSQSFSMPNGINSTTARVKVEPVGNIYFAINSRNFEVRSSNTPPVTAADNILVFEGGTATTLSNGATSVLNNDSDADGDSLSTVLVSNVTNGTLTLAPSGTGSFTYVHDGSETTTDSFTYRANDGTNNGNIVAVTINVTPTNDCPVVQNNISDLTAMEDDPDDIIDFSNVFNDPEGAMLTYTVSNTNTVLLSATISGTNIIVDYVDDETGTATITLTANDSGCGSTVDETFMITVGPQNDPPVGVDDTLTILEGGTTSTLSGGVTSVLINDTDTENDPLTATLLTGPVNHNGSFSLQSSGTFTYIHDGSETTTDSFSYSLTDGQSTASATVNISITPVNDCPTVVSPTADISAAEDDPDIVMNVANIFDDVDINPMPNTLSYSVTHTNASLATITLNAATLTIAFVDDQNGSTTVTLTADDNDGCTVDDDFIITVSAVNDPPVSNPNTINVDEGATANTTVNTYTSVLDNDTDTEGDPLVVSLVSSTTNGTLTFQPNGTFSYEHDGSETTTDSFTYKANDGSSDGNTVTVTININPINDCPSLPVGTTLPHVFNTLEDQQSPAYNLRNLLIDGDHTFHSYTVTHTNPSLGSMNLDAFGNGDGDLVFNPAANEFGSATGTITVSDGLCPLYIPISIIVQSVNDCPTVINPIADQTANEDDPDLIIDVGNVFTDIESSTLSYSAISNNLSLVTASAAGTAVTLDFQDNQFGSAIIVVTVTDGDINCTIDDSFNINVSGINDAPSTASDTISLVNGATATTLNDGITTTVLANDTDADGDAMTAVVVTSTVNGVLNLLANGTFTYTHDGSMTTTDSFTYYATDGMANGNTSTVYIYINNPPVAVADTINVMEAGTATTTTGGFTSVLNNDSDADGDAMTAQLVSNPTYGTITLNPNGTFTYVHNGANQTTDSFTYRANDGIISGAPVTVSINVSNTNDPPVANNDTIVVALNGTATTLDNGSTSLTNNDTDPDGDALTVSLVSSPSFGTLTLNPGGTFSYVQNGTLNGGDSFTYKVNDGTVDSGNATVNIYLSCSPCTESFIEGGTNGVTFSYTDCDCKNVWVHVPKGRAFTFCHLDGSINVVYGNYTLLSSKVCN